MLLQNARVKSGCSGRGSLLKKQIALKRRAMLAAFLAACLLLCGCTAQDSVGAESGASLPAANSTQPLSSSPAASSQTSSVPVSASSDEASQTQDPEQPQRQPAVSDTSTPEEPDEIALLLETMSLEEKVGQMFFVRCPEEGAAAVSQYQFGGYLLFGRDFEGKTPQQVSADIQSYQQNARLPLFIGVDEEGGTVNRISTNPNFRSSPFLSPRQLYAQGGMELLQSNAQEQCNLLASVGVNVNFAPVCDIAQNPADFMYDRSLGQDAQTTADFVRMTVEVYRQNKMGSVLKHFPGYGDNADTHTGIAYDSRSLSALREKDWIPFAAGIQAGAPCVLVSHNIVSAVDKDMPASLSPAVHNLLRQELGFNGVIITDDLSMGAIQEYTGASAAAVLAVKAGNDLLCCTDYETQLPAVVAAVQSGEISEEQINTSVARILQWKQSLGLL
ncbi:MAG TPA: beta-hexosaminidase [Candidatus Gallacutalibacter stercoravium]|nr:beta-hexosaminidase [Candidatus Gallacutalibacter stercoravium]